MISPFIKLILRPVVNALEAQLEKLHYQIKNGDTDAALKTVNQFQSALSAAKEKYL